MSILKNRRFTTVVLPVLVGIFLIGGGIVLYFHDPEASAGAPKCWFHLLTGWRCAGCGTQRALYHLLHLRPGQAVAYNPFLLIALPYLGLLFYLQYLGGAKRFPRLDKALFGRKGILTAFTVIAVYWIGRNLVGI